MKKKLLAHGNCSVLLGTFSPLRWQRILSEDLQSDSLHLNHWASLPSRPGERRNFFWLEKLLLFTHGLLWFLPSKFSFWSTTTHTRTYKQANLAKLTCSFSTRLQAETFAHFAEVQKKLLAHGNCSVLLGTFSPLRWQRILSEDLQSDSLHLNHWASLPSRPGERRNFFWFEKLLLFTHGLLWFLPSKFSFWSTTTHTNKDIETSQPGKTPCVSFSTRLQAVTFAIKKLRNLATYDPRITMPETVPQFPTEKLRLKKNTHTRIPRFSGRWLSRSFCCPCHLEILNCLHSDSGICEVKFPPIQTPSVSSKPESLTKIWGCLRSNKKHNQAHRQNSSVNSRELHWKAFSPQETAGRRKRFSTLGHCPPQGMKNILSKWG